MIKTWNSFDIVNEKEIPHVASEANKKSKSPNKRNSSNFSLDHENL